MTREFVEKKLFEWGFNPGYSGFAYLAGAICTMDKKGDWVDLGQALEPVSKKYSINTGTASTAIYRLKQRMKRNSNPPAEITAVMGSSCKTFVPTVFYVMRKEWEAEQCE